MNEIDLYFDASGNAGYLATEAGWAAFGDWAAGLDPDLFQEVLHLFQFGWCQNLPKLEGQLAAALDDSPPDDDDALDAAEDLLTQVEDRADADGAAAVTMAGRGS